MMNAVGKRSSAMGNNRVLTVQFIVMVRVYLLPLGAVDSSVLINGFLRRMHV